MADHECINEDKFLEIIGRLTKMQEVINNEIYGHANGNGLKAEVMFLKVENEKKQRLLGFAISSFFTAVAALLVAMFKGHN